MKEIAILMDRLAKAEGVNNTLLPGVRIFKTSRTQPRQPLCYDQGLLFVGQGSKRVFLGDIVYDYNPDNYLVVNVPLPAECETNATKHEPLLLLLMDIEMGMLNMIVSKMKDHSDEPFPERNENNQGLFLARASKEIKSSVHRLLTVLQSPLESRMLGPGIIEELVFRIMCSENAASLHALAMKNTNLSRIGKALKLIHGNYQEDMDVEKLAGHVNMSQSSFFRAFKDVTSSSPIQYLKNVRLNKAKKLLSEKGIRVSEAAAEVGYESAAQFSREFKRYFGSSPVNYT